jgi:hypothetical protein
MSRVVEYRWAEGQYDRLPAMVSELLRRHMAVIACLGTPFGARRKDCNRDDPDRQRPSPRSRIGGQNRGCQLLKFPINAAIIENSLEIPKYLRGLEGGTHETQCAFCGRRAELVCVFRWMRWGAGPSRLQGSGEGVAIWP